MSTILIVEDASELRQLYSLVLSGCGCDVVTANDGVEALTLARLSRFDLVVIDVFMPRMNGISLIRELRSLDNYQTTPLFVITSGGNKKLENRGLEAGATRWFVKPVDSDVLASTVRDAIAV